MEGKQATQKDSISDHQAIEINDDEWIKKLTTKLNKCHPRRQFQKRCTIFKVPEDIRKCDKEGAYDPVVVAIGPYHHGLANDSTVTAIQEFKWDCIRRLLSRRTKSSSEATALLRSCLLKMKEMDDQVRECYSEDLHHLSPHDLGRIMLLDGCFIIHLLLKFNEGNFKLIEMVNLKEESMAEAQEIVEEKEESMAEAIETVDEKESMAEARDIVEEKEDSMAKAQEKVELDMGREKSIDGRLEGMNVSISYQIVDDLLKLENQIPFFIVCELFGILKSSEDGEINLVKIACDLLQGFLNLKHGGEPPAIEAESLSIITLAAHIQAAMGALSGAAREAMSAVSRTATAALAPIGTACKGAHSTASRCNLWRFFQVAHFRRVSQDAGVKQTSHLRRRPLDKTEIHHLLHLFHSRLEPSETYYEEYSSKRGDSEWIPTASELQLGGIKFKENKEAKSFLDISFKNNGTIEIPQFYLEDVTNPLFKNLIAFEQCSADASKYITSYTLFMDYIINTSKDVQLLELEGILLNFMATDDAAASFFNGLHEKITHIPNQMYLLGLHWKVKNYYNSSYHKHRARLIRDYFSSPWAILSLLAAIFLLLLTAQQSFFSAYSYFRPPHA